MRAAIIFGCDVLATDGAQKRMWSGPADPDPVVVQFCATRLELSPPHDISGTLSRTVLPITRHGTVHEIDPFMTKLTGLTNENVKQFGQPLDRALSQLDAFSDGETLWSWGKAELTALAISCYIAGIAPPMKATRFGNISDLLLIAGYAASDIQTMKPNDLAKDLGVDRPKLRTQSAHDDTENCALVLQHLLKSNILRRDDFSV